MYSFDNLKEFFKFSLGRKTLSLSRFGTLAMFFQLLFREFPSFNSFPILVPRFLSPSIPAAATLSRTHSLFLRT